MGRAPAEVAGPLHGAGLRIVVFADGAAARQPFDVVELSWSNHLAHPHCCLLVGDFCPERDHPSLSIQ